MNDRESLERYLSGRDSLEDLPSGLRSEEQRLQSLMGALRDDPPTPASLRMRVMERVHAERLPGWRRAIDWLLRPRVVRLSPAAGGLALAGAAAVVALLVSTFAPTGGAVGGVMTRFVFIAPEASDVRVTGDFVDWSPDGIDLLDERGTGVWTVDVPLEPGVYQYAFVVDGGDWRPDPRAVSSVDDGFGRENSVVIVSDRGET